jgi:hypothetical protein
LLLVTSIALAIALIALLIKIGRVDLRAVLRQLQGVSLISFTKVVLLNCLLVLCSTEKWRSIDAAWRKTSDAVPSRMTSFTLTSVGLAVGVFLPVQLAMSTARTLGTYVHGRALKRGTAGTLLEQGFDLLTVGVLAAASGITRLYHGGAVMWAISAAVMIALALSATNPSIRLIRRSAISFNTQTAGPHNRVLRSFWELRHSGLLNAGLARRLVVLSSLRFGVVTLMSIQTARAIGLNIPLWQMAAAIPFVAIASIIALTPGAVGVNELASVTALAVFGTPLAVGAQWALANRVLVSVSYFLVAACAVIVLYGWKLLARGARDAMQDS